MYKSPIETFVDNVINTMIKKHDEDIYQAVIRYGVNVDKEELLKALNFDRQQYERGYADGKRDAMAELVRCKYCKHCSNNTPDGLHWCDEHERGSLMDDDFCSYGERSEGE